MWTKPGLGFGVQDLLTRHKALVAEYLLENYADFFASYNKLLQSENYVTKRQSLKVGLFCAR